MPKFNTQSANIETHKVGNFKYTAIPMGKLAEQGTSEKTIVLLVWDKSGSTYRFENISQNALEDVIRGCAACPRSDYLMLRTLTFDHDVHEIHGFRFLSDCVDDIDAPNPKVATDYNGILKPNGGTALYDTVGDAVESIRDYCEELDTKKDYLCNAVLVVLTDGRDEHSSLDVNFVRDSFQKLYQSESVESMISVLIGLNPYKDTQLAQFLSELKDAGFDEYIEIDDVNNNTMGKLAQWISQSISSQSQAIGSGTSSQLVKLEI